jgi:threonine/homoserine/homoserine lactone efflux protein
MTALTAAAGCFTMVTCHMCKRGVNLPLAMPELLSFAAVMVLMIITPGPNQVLVLQSGITIGPRAAALNVLGVASSMLIHASLSGLGISLLITQSPGLHGAVKLIGAGYIAYLGANSLVSANRLRRAAAADEAAASRETDGESGLKSFAKGFTTNILNIQTSFIFLSIYPQYMNGHDSLFVQSLLLTAIFIGLLLCWYSLLITLIFKVRHYLLRARIQAGIKAVTGTLLVALGVKMALGGR